MAFIIPSPWPSRAHNLESHSAFDIKKIELITVHPILKGEAAQNLSDILWFLSNLTTELALCELSDPWARGRAGILTNSGDGQHC